MPSKQVAVLRHHTRLLPTIASLQNLTELHFTILASLWGIEYHTGQRQSKLIMTTTTIDDVIHELSDIVEVCRQANSRLGYFPAMYRKVTVRIHEGLIHGRFQNPHLLEQLDVVFAQRYLDAYHQHQRGETPTQAWAYAFARAQDPRPSVMQHLLLGMNAHINLDLGIAAAQVCHNCPLDPLKADFFTINQVLAGLLDEVQAGVNETSTLFRYLDVLGGRFDESLGNFSLRRARLAAWEKAQALHRCPPTGRPHLIKQHDQAASRLARLVCPPFSITEGVTNRMNRADLQEPRAIIDVLANPLPST